MAKKQTLNVKFTLPDVRLSFPRLFTPGYFDDDDKAKGKDPTFQAQFILDKVKDMALIKKLQATIKDMCMKEFGEELESNRICLRDGKAKKDLDGYGPGVMFISSSCRHTQRPWVGKVSGGNLVPVLETDDGAPYAGCFVNATITLWAQSHPKYGKRINAQLRAVAKRRDGKAFGARAISDGDEEFADLQGDLGGDEDGSDLL